MPCHILEAEDFAISFVKPTGKLCCKADTSQEFDFSDRSQTDRSPRSDNLPFSIADHLVENPTFTASIAKKSYVFYVGQPASFFVNSTNNALINYPYGRRKHPHGLSF